METTSRTPERAAGVPPQTTQLAGTPAWRREPYRAFFVLGVVLTWAATGPWAAYAAGLTDQHRAIYHAIAQVQGFLTCFAVGFLFTAIPRRTGTPAPAAWEMVVCLLAPVVVTASAWARAWAITQAAWLVAVAVVMQFALARFLSSSATRRPPGSFIWVPLGFGIGLTGSAMIGAYGALGLEDFFWHELGKRLLLQGTFLGLIVGVGGMALPLITCGDAPPDEGGPGAWRRRLGHLAAAALLVASFVVELRLSHRGGLAMRALVTLGLLLVVGRIHRFPQKPGLHRRLVWLAAWSIPVGYGLAAALAPYHGAGLHVVFIGGFGLMALSVGMHVALAHGGHAELVAASPWPVWAFGGLFATAIPFRVLAQGDQARLPLWLGIAVAAYLLATLVWLGYVGPRLLRR